MLGLVAGRLCVYCLVGFPGSCFVCVVRLWWFDDLWLCLRCTAVSIGGFALRMIYVLRFQVGLLIVLICCVLLHAGSAGLGVCGLL